MLSNVALSNSAPRPPASFLPACRHLALNLGIRVRRGVCVCVVRVPESCHLRPGSWEPGLFWFSSVPLPTTSALPHPQPPVIRIERNGRQYLGWGCVTVAPALSRGEDRLGAGESLRRARPAAGGVAELVVESEPAVLLPNGCWCSSQSASTPAVAGDLKL